MKAVQLYATGHVKRRGALRLLRCWTTIGPTLQKGAAHVVMPMTHAITGLLVCEECDASQVALAARPDRTMHALRRTPGARTTTDARGHAGHDLRRCGHVPDRQHLSDRARGRARRARIEHVLGSDRLILAGWFRNDRDTGGAYCFFCAAHRVACRRL